MSDTFKIKPAEEPKTKEAETEKGNMAKVESALNKLDFSSLKHSTQDQNEDSKADKRSEKSSDQGSHKDGDADNDAADNDESDVPMTFPQRLMDILSKDEFSDILGWLPHGKGFMIYQKKRFATEIMPKYFKKSKYTSFTRKLNRWNFTRITRGPETGAYYHEYFQKDDLRLCMQMCCQSIKPAPPPVPTVPAGSLLAPSNNLALARLQLGKSDAMNMGNAYDRSNALHNLQNLGGLSTNGLAGNLLQQRQELLLQEQQKQGMADSTLLRLRQEQQMMLEQQRQNLLLQQQMQAQQNALAGNQMNMNALLSGPTSGLLGNTSASAESAMLSTLQNLQRQQNNSAFLSMLMPQEKTQAQGQMPNCSQQPSLPTAEYQAQILQAQQLQLANINQQRALLAAEQQRVGGQGTMGQGVNLMTSVKAGSADSLVPEELQQLVSRPNRMARRASAA